jgi:hypothetical protein
MLTAPPADLRTRKTNTKLHNKSAITALGNREANRLVVTLAVPTATRLRFTLGTQRPMFILLRSEARP